MESINHLYRWTVAPARPEICRRPIPTSDRALLSIRCFWALNFLLLLTLRLECLADETNSPAIPQPVWQQDTNLQEVLRGVLSLQDQMRSNQIAIEQNGKENRQAAARNADVLSNELRNLQETFSTQQRALSDRNTRELQSMQSSNRVVIMVGGIFAAVVSLILLLSVYFQWRISKAWTQISREGVGFKALGPGSTGADPTDASTERLLHAMEQLETRIHGLEDNATAVPGLRTSVLAPPDNGNATRTRTNAATSAGSENLGGHQQARIAAWLEQGQSMLKQNDWQAALQCFDEVLALAPNHSEALVKKGAALERLKKLNEAFECYERAIAADESMTMAYLHKGGLCSRLERFKEALECYEKALRTHTDWDG